ncbi:MAG: hypothetical protein ACI38A_04885 [Candidatus Ornithomonoglobus sp.]
MNKKITAVVSAVCIAVSAFSQLYAYAADSITYTFNGTNIVTTGEPIDYTDVKLTDDISLTTSGDMNRKYAAVTTLENNKNVGTFPVYDTFKAEGSYIYLACTNVNNNSIFALNMPAIPAGSKVTLTYAKPTVTNNGSTIRNANDPYAYLKIADRYISINGDEFDTWLTKSVVTGEDTGAIEFHCDMWGAIAISKIEISDGDGKPLHSVTINSTQYANMLVNGIKFCADGNGTLTVPSLPEGETVSVSAEKDGYLKNETSVTVGSSDLTIDLPLECETDDVYYESDFGNASGVLALDGEFSVGEITAKDITKISSRITFAEGGTLKLTDSLTLKYDNGIYANNTYITSKDNMEFEVVSDKTAGKTILTQNNNPLYTDAVPFDVITAISGSNVTVEYIGISYPDKNSLVINGSNKVSSVAEGRTYAEYSVTPAYLVPDAKAVFSVEGNDGVTIDENGKMTVAGGLDAGTVTVISEYDGIKTAKTVEIVPNPKVDSFDINTGEFPNLYTTSKLDITNIKDEFGNLLEVPVKDFNSVLSGGFENRAAVTQNGIITAQSCGETAVSFNIFTGADNEELFSAPIEQYYISGITTGNAQYIRSEIKENAVDSYKINYSDGTSESIELTDIPAATVKENCSAVISSYDDKGALISSVKHAVKAGDTVEVSDSSKTVYLYSGSGFFKVTEADTTLKGFKIEHKAGLKFEIAPVYKFTDIGDTAEPECLEQFFTDGCYDITFKKAEAARGDIYVNGTMVGNNVDQADADRKVFDGALYTAEDVNITGGKISVSMTDGSTMLDYVTVTKKPEFYERPQRVYVIGDSLACAYYGDFEQEVGGGRAGWGQQLPDFLKVPVTNLANSGQFAAGLYATAFPGVIANAQEGDILLIECAYNDRAYSTRDEMISCVKSMIEECREKGIIPILVTPNASAHDYKPSVVWSSYLRDIAVDTDCQLIDLSQKSYDLLYSIYGDDADGNITKNFNLTEVGGDTLHSSYAGAYVWASVVAQGLKDLGYGDIVNTDFKYTFTDTIGNEITAQVK